MGMHWGFGWLIAKGVEWVMGKAVDSATGPDMLDPDFEDQLEALDAGPVHPHEKLGGVMGRGELREVMAKVSAGLERGLRESQVEVLGAKSGRLSVGESFQLHSNVFHGGSPTGLQISVLRGDAESLFVLVEGRGPAMEVVRRVYEEKGVSLEGERSGEFQLHLDGTHWWADLPEGSGTFLDQPVRVEVDRLWRGLNGDEEPGESEVLGAILGELRAILGAAEMAFEQSVDEEVAGDVGEVTMKFSSRSAAADLWSLEIARSGWEEFRWRIDFRGSEFLDFSAGS